MMQMHKIKKKPIKSSSKRLIAGVLTPAWGGRHGQPHLGPAGRRTPPAGLDPPSAEGDDADIEPEFTNQPNA